MTSNFTDLGIPNEIVRAMNDMGWTEPTPVQIDAIPIGLSGRDMFAQAQTGTGKTGTYGSIVLGTTQPHHKIPTVLVLTPTRELAVQVAGEIDKLSKYTGHKCMPIYGGVSIDNQVRNLSKGVDIVIGTPGRLKDLITRKNLILSDISTVVLDEADRMLDMGFAKDMDFILSKITKERQTLLFSATMSSDIKRLANRQMHDHVDVLVSKDEPTLDLTTQYYLQTDKDSKRDELCKILDAGNPKTIVFCHTKRRVNQLTKKLIAAGYKAGAIHGDVAQNKRERVITDFKNDVLDILVATDVAARGLDIDNVDCAVNYDMPVDPETYVHRIGRTGRAGKQGLAITFVLNEEMGDLKAVEKQIGKGVDKLTPDVLSKTDFAERTPKAAPAEPKTQGASSRKASGTEKNVIGNKPSRFKKVVPADDRVSVEIGLGRMDGMEKSDVCEFIKEKASLKPKEVGSITLNEKKSIVEISGDKVDSVVSKLSQCSYEGRRLKVRVLPKK